MIPDVSLSKLSGLKPGDANDPKAVADKVQGTSIIYRVRLHKDERAAAIYLEVSRRSLEVERRFGFILRRPLFERGSFSS